MTYSPDPAAIVDAAAVAVQAQLGVTITPESRAVLRTWAESNAQRIAEQVQQGWTDEQFVAAAHKVLEAAAVRTLNPPGTTRYLIEPEGQHHDTTVGAYATAKALPDNCPFFGC